jgi:hypothetical protein
MRKFTSFFEEPVCESPAAVTRALKIPVILDPKCNTWYYGVRCTCERFLALCEDCFAGKGNEDVLKTPTPLAVECECGAVTSARVLEKFKTP